MTSLPSLLLQAAAPLRGWLDLLVALATIAGGLSLVIIAAVLVRAALAARDAAAGAGPELRRFRDEVAPALRDVSAAAAQVAALSGAMRGTADRVTALVEDATTRGHLALDQAERRARELDALVRMVQDEATRAMAMAGALTRGVQAGLTVLRGGGGTGGTTPDDHDAEEAPRDDDRSERAAPHGERPSVRGRRQG